MYNLKFWNNNQLKDRCNFLSFDNYNKVFCFEKKDYVDNKTCTRCLQSKKDICKNLLDKAKKLATSRSEMAENNFYLIDITDDFANKFIDVKNKNDKFYMQVYFQHSNKYDIVISSYNKDYNRCHFLDFNEVMSKITEKHIRKS